MKAYIVRSVIGCLAIAGSWSMQEAQGGSYNFNSTGQLDDFAKTGGNASFWAIHPGTGIGGTDSLKGVNTSTPGWMIHQQSASVEAPFTAYIDFQWQQETVNLGYSLLVGAVSTSNYSFTLSGGTETPGMHHLVAVVHNDGTTGNNTIRVGVLQAQNITSANIAYSDYMTLTPGSWYRLQLDFEWDGTRFDALGSIYSLNNTTGAVTGLLESVTRNNLLMNDLHANGVIYSAFGINGQSQNRGITGVDNFYTSVPEPSGGVLMLLGLSGVLFSRKKR